MNKLFFFACIALLIIITAFNNCSNLPLAQPTERNLKPISTDKTPQKTPLSATQTTFNHTPLPTNTTTKSITKLPTTVSAIQTTAVIIQPKTTTPTITKTPIPTSTPITPYPTTTWLPPQKQADTTNWLTFSDEEAGYSFKYPPNTTVSSKSVMVLNFKETIVVFQADNSPQARIFISALENQENLNLKEYLTELDTKTDVRADYLTDRVQIEINGVPGIWYKASTASELDILLISEEKTFNFIVVNFLNYPDRRKMNDANKDLAYQILNTFTLLP